MTVLAVVSVVAVLLLVIVVLSCILLCKHTRATRARDLRAHPRGSALPAAITPFAGVRRVVAGPAKACPRAASAGASAGAPGGDAEGSLPPAYASQAGRRREGGHEACAVPQGREGGGAAPRQAGMRSDARSQRRTSAELLSSTPLLPHPM